MLIAAGATFYLLLALFPALTAFVSLYGFLADRAAIAGNTSMFIGILPMDSINLIRSQLEALAAQDTKVLASASSSDFSWRFGARTMASKPSSKH